MPEQAAVTATTEAGSRAPQWRSVDPVEPFRGLVAVITGGGGGIGAALGRALVARGATVVLADRRPPPDGDSPAGAIPVSCDVADPSAVHELEAWVHRAVGPVDLLFNNAGIALPPTDLPEVSTDQWRRVLAVNLYGVIHGIRSFLPGMLERRRGYIVNTASMAGLVPSNPLGIPYATSKFAVSGLTQGLALALRPRGIQVSCLCPGAVDTAVLATSVGSTDVGARYLPPGTVVTSPDSVAQQVLRAMVEERFLILTQSDHAQLIGAAWSDLDRTIDAKSATIWNTR